MVDKTGRVDCECGHQIMSNSGKVMSRMTNMVVCWNHECNRVYDYNAVEKARIDNQVVVFHSPGKDLKVFKMNDCDWWLDYSEMEAIKNYSDFIDCIPEDATEQHELTNEELKDHVFCLEDNVEYSFFEELQRRQSISNKPDFFASTEY